MLRFAIFFLIVCSLASCKEGPIKPIEEEVEYIDPAVEGISQLISKDTSNSDLRYKRAKLLYDRELYSQAIEDLEFALVRDSLQPEYYHLLADSYMDYYRSRDAINILNKCLMHFPGRTETLLKLSEFYFILKQTDHSLNTLNFIVMKNPQNAEAFYMLGMNFKEMEDKDRAINSFQRAVELDASLTDGWIALGDLYTAKNDKQALQYYRNAKLSDSKSTIAVHALAYYLQEHGREEEAIREYDKIIMMDKNYGAAYLNAGILMLEKDSLQYALEKFKILTQIEPSNPKAHFYSGVAYENMSDTTRAITSYENALNLDPDYINARTQIGQLTK